MRHLEINLSIEHLDMKRVLTLASIFIITHMLLSLALRFNATALGMYGETFVYSEPSSGFKFISFLSQVFLYPAYIPLEHLGIVNYFTSSIIDWLILFLNSAFWYAAVLLSYTFIRYRSGYLDAA